MELDEISNNSIEVEPLSGIKYYAVVVLKDYSVHMFPTDSEGLAESMIIDVYQLPKYKNKIISTQIIKRNMENKKYKGGKRIL